MAFPCFLYRFNNFTSITELTICNIFPDVLAVTSSIRRVSLEIFLLEKITKITYTGKKAAIKKNSFLLIVKEIITAPKNSKIAENNDTVDEENNVIIELHSDVLEITYPISCLS